MKEGGLGDYGRKPMVHHGKRNSKSEYNKGLKGLWGENRKRGKAIGGGHTKEKKKRRLERLDLRWGSNVGSLGNRTRGKGEVTHEG